MHSQTNPQVLFFDLDDTLLADSRAADDCWMLVCDRYSGELGVSPQVLYEALLLKRDWFWSDPVRHQRGRLDMQAARREIVVAAFEALHLQRPDVADRLADDYTEERHRRVEVFPGAIETLEVFAQRGARLALLTNGHARYQRSKIARFNLERLFQCIVIESEFGVGKPHEAVFRHALSSLGAHAEDVWMVGNDLRFDIEPALRLGMVGIWVDHDGNGLPLNPPCQPSRTIGSVAELIT